MKSKILLLLIFSVFLGKPSYLKSQTTIIGYSDIFTIGSPFYEYPNIVGYSPVFTLGSPMYEHPNVVGYSGVFAMNMMGEYITGYSGWFALNTEWMPLTAGFNANNKKPQINQTVQFSDQSVGTVPPYSWVWDFGDGTPVSTQKNPVHSYNRAGAFKVTLTVTNSIGAQSVKEIPNYITVGSDNNGIELQIVETGEQGVVKWVGYEYRNRNGNLITVNNFPVQDHKASITWNSKDLKENDFNDEIILYTEFLGYKMKSGHVKFEYEHSSESGATRNAVIFFHNDAEMCVTNGKTYFPYSSSNPDYDKNWEYYRINEYPVSMLIPPDNSFPITYNKQPVLFVHGWEGWFYHSSNPDATWGSNEVSYWFTTVEKMNDFSTYHAWQFYYPYNTDHQHVAYCLKQAMIWLKQKYSQKIRIVTHSMGGLVTMRYLTEFNNTQTHPDHLSKNYVEKVLFSAPPAHGSLGANLYHKTDFGPTLEKLLGYDSEAPAVRDMKIGSDATWFIHHNPWPDLNSSGNLYDDYFVLLGTTYKYYTSDAYYQAYTKLGWTNVPNSCIHEEAKNHHDGIVSISSGSLLDQGIGFATFHGNHNDAVHMQSFVRNDPSKQNIGDPDLLPNIAQKYFSNNYQGFVNYLNGNPEISAIVNHDRGVIKPGGQNTLDNLNTSSDVNYQKGIVTLEFGNAPRTDVYTCWYNRSKHKLYLLPFNYASTIRMILPKWWMDLIAMPIAQETFYGVYLKNSNSANKNRFYFNSDDVISKSIGQFFYKGCAADMEEGINTIQVFNGFFRTVAKNTVDFRFCETNTLILDNTKSGNTENYQDNTDIKFQTFATGFAPVTNNLIPFFIDDQASEIEFVFSGLLSEETGNAFILKLQLPDGNIADSTYSGGTFWHDFDLGELTMTIPNPQPGKWKVWIESSALGADTLEYQAITYLQSDLHAYLADSIITVNAGKNHLFQVGLRMDTLALADSLKVNATIYKPSGFSEKIDFTSVPLPTDSSLIFLYDYQIDSAGYYMVKFNLDGVYNGYRFERALWQQFEAIDTIPFLNIPDVTLRQNEPQMTLNLSQSVYNVNDYDTLYFSQEIIASNLDSLKFSSKLDSLALTSYMTTRLADTGTVVLRFDCHFDDHIISDTVQVKVLLPDLLVDNIQISDSILQNESEVLVSYTLKNTGNYHSRAYDVRYYFSADSVLQPDDLCLGQKNILYHNIDSVLFITDTLFLPTLTLTGNAFLLVSADAAGQINEPDETNNLVVQSVMLNLPPVAPIIVSAIPDDASVLLTWSPNQEEGNTGYVIWYGTDSTCVLNKIYTLSSDTLRLITGLTNETTYYFAVSAYRLMGNESGLSPFESATPSLLASQSFQISQGWSGLSVYFTPLDANVETMLQPIVSELIILESETGMYWPGQNVNTIGNWDTHEGYKIKVANTVGLSLTGLRQIEKTLQLGEGWNLIPVLSECPADAVSLFAGKPLVIAKEVAGWDMYWPEYGINTLEVLEPGKAYFVMMSADDLVTYPDCQAGMKSWMNPSAKKVIEDAQYRKLLIENKISPTAITHTLVLPGSAFNKCSYGDQIMALDELGNCFGLTILNTENTSMTLFGDDPVTPEKDGFSEHETITFRMKTQESDVAQEMADVVFDSSLPQHDGLFYGNGLSSVTDFRLKTAQEGFGEDNEISIYPNPTGNLLYLQVKTVGNLTFVITNMFGQQILNGKAVEKTTEIDLSSLAPGVYSIAVFDENLQVVKQIIKE